MKVSNLLRKLGETDVKLTPELSEVSSASATPGRRLLQDAIVISGYLGLLLRGRGIRESLHHLTRCPFRPQELENVRRVLAQSPNLNMPDISKQLKLLEAGAEHSTDLAAFLVDSATYANGDENDTDSEGCVSRSNSITPIHSASVSYTAGAQHISQKYNSRMPVSFTGKLQALFQMDAATRRATFDTPDCTRVDP